MLSMGLSGVIFQRAIEMNVSTGRQSHSLVQGFPGSLSRKLSPPPQHRHKRPFGGLYWNPSTKEEEADGVQDQPRLCGD